MITIDSCPKNYTRDLDKACSPGETVTRIKNILRQNGKEILAENRRIDTGRLNIPVFMSICGSDAKDIMPGRKQMGKGTAPEQAEASALMELMERYSFFAFWKQLTLTSPMTWSQAQAAYGDRLMPLEQIMRSVNETIDVDTARKMLDLTTWRFCEGTCLTQNKEIIVPFDWFKQLNEYNGASAGNTPAESILQGTCELVERHVSAMVDQDHRLLPTIVIQPDDDPVLLELQNKFTSHGIQVWLKDMTCSMPLPTVAALAYDPATFPKTSEIVFTAGTATSPAKAAIRALTEVAQLAGDFESKTTYEPSGLAKYNSLEEITWITRGPSCRLSDLPKVESDDIAVELTRTMERLASLGYTLYSVQTTQPGLDIPTHYSCVPGFQFRERTRLATIGMLTGRHIVEQEPPEQGAHKLDLLEALAPQKYVIPFFRGQIFLKQEQPEEAAHFFAQAEALQPDTENKAMSAFYQAYCLTMQAKWSEALGHLDRAILLQNDVKEYYNLRGVAYFKQKKFESALVNFQAALALDAGSAMDMANMGMCYKHLGKKQEATTFLREAVTMDASIEFAWEHLLELTS
ncbi:MAG: YcaO-like family protein [Desulfoplanes sp.]|nr:YcaO-like family protein [Desulfoplanes sp.]